MINDYNCQNIKKVTFYTRWIRETSYESENHEFSIYLTTSTLTFMDFFFLNIFLKNWGILLIILKSYLIHIGISFPPLYFSINLSGILFFFGRFDVVSILRRWKSYFLSSLNTIRSTNFLIGLTRKIRIRSQCTSSAKYTLHVRLRLNN